MIDEKVSNSNSTTSFAKKVITGIFGYGFMYFSLMTYPTFFKYYLQYYSSVTPPISEDLPTQITEANEIFTVHSFDDALPYMGKDAVIFRNFTNCAEKFEKVLYPRRKDKQDHVELINHEKGPGNVFLPGISRKRKVLPKTLKEILDEKSNDYFPSFLQLFDDQDYQVLLNANNDTRFRVESTFISHFNRNMVTTPSHGDQRAQSLAVQCYGTRSFLFHRFSDLVKHGFMPVPIINGATMGGTPGSINKIPTIRAIVNPGDVLYFPPMYYHAVAATKGKNILFSVRKADKASMKLTAKTSPSFLIIAGLRVKYRDMFHKAEKKGFHITGDYMPYFDEYVDVVQKKRRAAGFADYDGLADFGLPDSP